MIENDKQLKITKIQLENFKRALDHEKNSNKIWQPLKTYANINGLKSIIQELEQEIFEYEGYNA